MTDRPPDDSTLRALIAGSLTQQQQADLECRLTTDPDLRDRLDNLTRAADFTANFIPTEPTAPPVTKELTYLIETLHATTPDAIPPPRSTDLDPSTFLAPPRTDGSIGSLGTYDIQEIIGQGGMGIVFRAHDPALQRTVAIKALSPALAASTTAREQFLREARSAAALDHEHILPIHAVDQHGTLPYFVMPLVDGPTLHDILEPGTPLPLPEIIRYATAVSAALEAAHAKDIVHRDIKPANILTDPESGRIWITDFGIANPSGSETGTLAGTPHYISPEQAAGQPTTAASDRFSLGVIIYQMATATLPFEGEHTKEILEAVSSHAPPPPSSLNPKIPTRLDALTISLLSKSPGDRPQSDSTITSTLNSLKKSGSAPQRILVLVLFAALIAVSAALLRPGEQPAPPEGQLPLFSIAGDGRSFPTLVSAIAATTPGSPTVLINSDATLELTPITTPPHPVVIRAAPGTGPVLRFSEVDAPLFTARGPLEFHHLTIVQRALRRSAPRIPPVVLSAGSPLTVNNCRISRIAPTVGRVPGGDFNLEIIPPVFRLEQPTELTVANSEIYALRGIGVSALIPDGTTKISFRNSIVATRRFIDTTASANTALDITLERNLLMASVLFDFLPNPTHPQVSVTAKLNILELRGGIVWARSLTQEDFTPTFTWTGSSNAYQIPHIAVHYGGAFDITNSNRPSQREFKFWVNLPNVTESESVSRNIKASDQLDLRNTALDTITAADFHFNPKAAEFHPGLGPDATLIGPAAANQVSRQGSSQK